MERYDEITTKGEEEEKKSINTKHNRPTDQSVSQSVSQCQQRANSNIDGITSN